MKTSRMTVDFAKDSPDAHVTFVGDDGRASSMTLGADEMDDILRRLGEARLKVLPWVETNLFLDFDRVLYGCDWRVISDSPAERRIVAVRHPGFGWLAFGLSPNDVRSLQATLQGDEADTRH